MELDIYWFLMVGYILIFIVNGGCYDQIFFIEKFNDGMQKVLDVVLIWVKLDVNDVFKFNEFEGYGFKCVYKISEYFDDLLCYLVWEIYKKDFQLFKYDFDNFDNKMFKFEVDLNEVYVKLGC